MFFFFFSSRRRHTRCGRDWSSDVCSSDLEWKASASNRSGDRKEDRDVFSGAEEGRVMATILNKPLTTRDRLESARTAAPCVAELTTEQKNLLLRALADAIEVEAAS